MIRGAHTSLTCRTPAKVDPSTKWSFLPCRSLRHPLNVALLAVPEVTASTLFGMVDLFASAGRDWSLLLSGVEGEQRIRPYIVAVQQAGFVAANGIWVRPHYGLADAPKPDIVCVPDFSVVPGEPLDGRFNAEVAWLRSLPRGGRDNGERLFRCFVTGRGRSARRMRRDDPLGVCRVPRALPRRARADEPVARGNRQWRADRNGRWRARAGRTWRST